MWLGLLVLIMLTTGTASADVGPLRNSSSPSPSLMVEKWRRALNLTLERMRTAQLSRTSVIIEESETGQREFTNPEDDGGSDSVSTEFTTETANITTTTSTSTSQESDEKATMQPPPDPLKVHYGDYNFPNLAGV